MSSTLAPAALMTANELFEMPDDGLFHELVKGELITMPPTGGEHGASTMNLAAPLKVHVDANDLGVVFAAETGYRLTQNPDTVRAPDVSFVRRERVAESGIPPGFLNFAPDLAVEVVSPHDKLYEVDDKVDEYLADGTQAVCVVYPKRRTVTVHRPSQTPQMLNETDTLDLDDVVVGFRFPVKKIFAGV